MKAVEAYQRPGVYTASWHENACIIAVVAPGVGFYCCVLSNLDLIKPLGGPIYQANNSCWSSADFQPLDAEIIWNDAIIVGVKLRTHTRQEALDHPGVYTHPAFPGWHVIVPHPGPLNHQSAVAVDENGFMFRTGLTQSAGYVRTNKTYEVKIK